MHRIRKRLTYANVMSSIAVFLLLGGAAYAAGQLPKNSVGTKQLKKNAVIGSKVKDASLTGADINLSSLGSVPSATHASSSDNATHATNADNATNANSLQGHPASDFAVATSAGRVARSSTADLTTITNHAGFLQVAHVTISVPAAQFVKVDAFYTITGGGETYASFLRERGTPNVSPTEYDELSIQNSQGLSWVFPTTAGTRTYDLYVAEDGTSNAGLLDPIMIATTIPFGATGGATLSAVARPKLDTNSIAP